MSQKRWFIGAGAVVIIAIIAGFGFLMRLKKQSVSVPVLQREAVQSGASEQQAPQTNVPVETVRAGYKKVSVKTDLAGFSFEIPEKWLTETRRSEWKSPTVDQMRDFLATSSRGDIKTNAKLFSDYVDISWKELKDMSSEAIRDLYNRDFFSTASVSGDGYIWYTDWNAGQIDFHVVKDFKKSDMWAIKDFYNAKKKDRNMSWSIEKVNGLDADVIIVSAGKDKNGKEQITKGETGGRIYFIKINGEKDMIVINKEAKGDAQFETDFENLLATFKLTNEENVTLNSCESGEGVYFEVKEFGIKFLVDKDLKNDLTYSVYTPDPADPTHVVAKFSTKSLAQADSSCSAESGSIGSIYKIRGMTDKVDGGFFAGKKESVKQFQDFFVAFQRPQAPCTEKRKVQEETIQFANKLESEFTKNIACLEKM